MKAKTIDSARVEDFVERKRENKDPKISTLNMGECGFGDWWDESKGEKVSQKLLGKIAELEDQKKPINVLTFDPFASRVLHEELNLDPILVAEDGFWRWLSVLQFYEIIEKRMANSDGTYAGHIGNFGGGGKPIKDNHRLAILWYRAQTFYDPENENPYHLTERPLQTDFVESGISRVRYGWCRNLAREFVKFQYPDPNSSDVYLVRGKTGFRMLIKRLRQRHATTAFEYLSPNKIQDILHELSEDLEKS